MDFKAITDTKQALRETDAYMTRARLEDAERWDEIIAEMPFLTFPESWEIAIIPPFGGAVSRFLVRRGAASVSVYCDYYDRLGVVREPYWEIHPDASLEDCARFLLRETDDLLAGILASLNSQDERDSDTRPQDGDAQQGSTRE